MMGKETDVLGSLSFDAVQAAEDIRQREMVARRVQGRESAEKIAQKFREQFSSQNQEKPAGVKEAVLELIEQVHNERDNAPSGNFQKAAVYVVEAGKQGWIGPQGDGTKEVFEAIASALTTEEVSKALLPILKTLMEKGAQLSVRGETALHEAYKALLKKDSNAAAIIRRVIANAADTHKLKIENFDSKFPPPRIVKETSASRNQARTATSKPSDTHVTAKSVTESASSQLSQGQKVDTLGGIYIKVDKNARAVVDAPPPRPQIQRQATLRTSDNQARKVESSDVPRVVKNDAQRRAPRTPQETVKISHKDPKDNEYARRLREIEERERKVAEAERALQKARNTIREQKTMSEIDRREQTVAQREAALLREETARREKERSVREGRDSPTSEATRRSGNRSETDFAGEPAELTRKRDEIKKIEERVKDLRGKIREAAFNVKKFQSVYSEDEWRKLQASIGEGFESVDAETAISLAEKMGGNGGKMFQEYAELEAEMRQKSAELREMIKEQFGDELHASGWQQGNPERGLMDPVDRASEKLSLDHMVGRDLSAKLQEARDYINFYNLRDTGILIREQSKLDPSKTEQWVFKDEKAKKAFQEKVDDFLQELFGSIDANESQPFDQLFDQMRHFPYLQEIKGLIKEIQMEILEPTEVPQLYKSTSTPEEKAYQNKLKDSYDFIKGMISYTNSVRNYRQIFHDLPIYAMDASSLERWGGILAAIPPTQIAMFLNDPLVEMGMAVYTRYLTTTLVMNKNQIPSKILAGQYDAEKRVYSNPDIEKVKEIMHQLVNMLKSQGVQIDENRITSAIAQVRGLSIVSLRGFEVIGMGEARDDFEGLPDIIAKIWTRHNWNMGRGGNKNPLSHELLSNLKVKMNPEVKSFMKAYWDRTKATFTASKHNPYLIHNKAELGFDAFGDLDSDIDVEQTWTELMNIFNLGSLYTRNGWRISHILKPGDKGHKEVSKAMHDAHLDYKHSGHWSKQEWDTFAEIITKEIGSGALWFYYGAGHGGRAFSAAEQFFFMEKGRDFHPKEAKMIDNRINAVQARLNTNLSDADRKIALKELHEERKKLMKLGEKANFMAYEEADQTQTRTFETFTYKLKKNGIDYEKKLTVPDILKMQTDQMRGESFWRGMRRNPGDFILTVGQMAPGILDKDPDVLGLLNDKKLEKLYALYGETRDKKVVRPDPTTGKYSYPARYTPPEDHGHAVEYDVDFHEFVDRFGLKDYLYADGLTDPNATPAARKEAMKRLDEALIKMGDMALLSREMTQNESVGLKKILKKASGGRINKEMANLPKSVTDLLKGANERVAMRNKWGSEKVLDQLREINEWADDVEEKYKDDPRFAEFKKGKDRRTAIMEYVISELGLSMENVRKITEKRNDSASGQTTQAAHGHGHHATPPVADYMKGSHISDTVLRDLIFGNNGFMTRLDKPENKDFGDIDRINKDNFFYATARMWEHNNKEIHPNTNDIDNLQIYKNIADVGEQVNKRLISDLPEWSAVREELRSLDEMLEHLAKHGDPSKFLELHNKIFHLKNISGPAQAERANYLLATLVSTFMMEHDLARSPLVMGTPWEKLAEYSLGNKISISKIVFKDAQSWDIDDIRKYYGALDEHGLIAKHGRSSTEEAGHALDVRDADYNLKNTFAIISLVSIILMFYMIRKGYKDADSGGGGGGGGHGGGHGHH